jgi:hypothetical protein
MTAGDGAMGCIWDERWYDVGAHSDGASREQRPDVPLPALEHVKMDATSTGELGRIVVWRAERRRRPRAKGVSVQATAGTSRAGHRVLSGHAHCEGTADERRMSPN